MKNPITIAMGMGTVSSIYIIDFMDSLFRSSMLFTPPCTIILNRLYIIIMMPDRLSALLQSRTAIDSRIQDRRGNME
jgi:hypothetical protein